MRKKIIGTCHLCGEQNIKLSFEHVPPESAFNDHGVVLATQKQNEDFLLGNLDVLNWTGNKGRICQRGSGSYTLCEPCNNNTGKWYGAEYASWTKQAFEYVHRIKSDTKNVIPIYFYGKPLLFIKQIITMFFSVNSQKFQEKNEYLKKFCLDPFQNGLPEDVGIDLTLLTGNKARNHGVSSSINILTNEIKIFSEICYPPFAFELIYGKHSFRCPIHHFANFDYCDNPRSIRINPYLGHISTIYPGDYRDSFTLQKESEQNKLILP